MMRTGLVIFVLGVALSLASCALCGEWADRNSLRPFLWLLSIGLFLVALGYGLITWAAVLR